MRISSSGFRGSRPKGIANSAFSAPRRAASTWVLTRAVAALTTDIGDHRGFVENQRSSRRHGSRVALETLERGCRRKVASGGPDSWPVRTKSLPLTGGNVWLRLMSVYGQPVLEHRRAVRSVVRQCDERGRVTTRAERIVDQEPLDLLSLALLCPELAIAKAVAPTGARALGIGKGSRRSAGWPAGSGPPIARSARDRTPSGPRTRRGGRPRSPASRCRDLAAPDPDPSDSQSATKKIASRNSKGSRRSPQFPSRKPERLAAPELSPDAARSGNPGWPCFELTSERSGNATPIPVKGAFRHR